MNSTAMLKNTLDSFFNEKGFSALIVRGTWGIGKTYFWENYIEDKIKRKEINQTAYSYVSLFGLNSLQELKSKIFRVARLLKTKKEVKQELEASSQQENQTLRILFEMKSKSQNVFRFLAPMYTIAKSLPQSKEFASLIDIAEYGLIGNYLICLDDIERKDDGLTIRQIMGFIDEASKRKDCKFILILNEKTLSEDDLTELNRYREKVVDLEIEYKPTIRDNLLKVFQAEQPYFEEILEVFQILDALNIRIFKKLKWSIDKIYPLIEISERRLQIEIIVHLAVFCWGFFNSESSLSLNFIDQSIKEMTWLSILTQREEDVNEKDEEKKWKQIASSLALYPSDYDDCLISMLTDGYLNEKAFLEEIEKANQKEKMDIIQAKFRAAWSIYADSFNDNVEDLKSAIRAVLEADLNKISLWDFSQSIDFLEKFGDDVNIYIDKYLTMHSEELANTDPEDYWDVSKIKNSVLEKRIQELRDKAMDFNIDNVLNNIIETQGWRRGEVEFLSSLTEEQIYDWMMSKPDRMVLKIKKGLFLFKGLRSNNEEEDQRYKAIANNTLAALKQIAKQNSLNKMRVELIYGIQI